MATELILIRHGNAVRVNGSYLHATLTTLGKQQAAQTGQHLREKHQPLDGFYTSPLRRATETAAVIGCEIDETPQVQSDMREMEMLEVPALALLEVLSIFDPVEDYLDANAGRPIRWPIEGRVSRVLTQVVAMHPNQRVAVVAHCGVISSALAWFFTERRLHWWMTIVDNCSLTRLQVDGARAELLAVNEIQHLTPVATTAQSPARTVRLARKVLQTKRRLPPKHS
jgi:2,3-bisphosphoglycerate-dependent phosphoglycerate mutase